MPEQGDKAVAPPIGGARDEILTEENPMLRSILLWMIGIPIPIIILIWLFLD